MPDIDWKSVIDSDTPAETLREAMTDCEQQDDWDDVMIVVIRKDEDGEPTRMSYYTNGLTAERMYWIAGCLTHHLIAGED